MAKAKLVIVELGIDVAGVDEMMKSPSTVEHLPSTNGSLQI